MPKRVTPTRPPTKLSNATTTTTNSTPAMAPRTLVADNGSYTIKAGFVSANPSYNDCYLIPNCIARSRDRRSLVGTQIESCRDFGQMAFRRPVEKVCSFTTVPPPPPPPPADGTP